MKTCYWCSAALNGELAPQGDIHLKCARAAWGSNKRNGCVIGFMLLPIALVGFILGCLWSALKAGFEEGAGLWNTVWGFIEKPRP